MVINIFKQKLRMVIRLILISILVLLQNLLQAQDRTQELYQILDSFAVEMPALHMKVDVSVTDASIHEFLKAVSKNVTLNLVADPDLNYTVSNTFNQVKIIDIIIFICRQHNLEVYKVGNIINFTKYKAKSKPEPLKVQKNRRYFMTQIQTS